MSVPMETNSEPPRAWLMGRPKWPAINLPLVGLFCEHHSPSLQRCVSPCLKLRLKMTAFQRITNNFLFQKKLLQTHLPYLNLSVVEMGVGGVGVWGGSRCWSTINMEFTHCFTSPFLTASTHNTALPKTPPAATKQFPPKGAANKVSRDSL